MQANNLKAFSMIELIFVIVLIGILSAIALPKLGNTVHHAHLTKAKSTLASVRSALSTERQKRILRGDVSVPLEDLGDGTYAFRYFDNNDSLPVLQYPVKSCGTEACWKRTAAVTYKYYISDTEIATFTLDLDKYRLDCADDDTTQCEKITQ